MWRHVVLLTDVSEERIAFIFRVYSYLLTLVNRSWISHTLKMEAIHSFETSVNKISTRRHIPEDGILYIVSGPHCILNNLKMISKYVIYFENIIK
jgi:hypothetical protein